jgi:hypothetical protein
MAAENGRTTLVVKAVRPRLMPPQSEAPAHWPIQFSERIGASFAWADELSPPGLVLL